MRLRSRALDNIDALEEKQGVVVVNEEDWEKEFDTFKADELISSREQIDIILVPEDIQFKMSNC